jgi:hypothetical protein
VRERIPPLKKSNSKQQKAIITFTVSSNYQHALSYQQQLPLPLLQTTSNNNMSTQLKHNDEKESINFKKEMIFSSEGVDQLGRQVGIPLPQDVVKLHIKGSYASTRPLFKIGKKGFGASKLRKMEFLSSHIIGETAFFEVPIQTTTSSTKVPKTVAEILEPCVRTMVLGEQSIFTLDFASMDETTKDLFCGAKIHKGHYKNMPRDAEKLIFDLDSFRIVRPDPSKKNVKIEHYRKSRNGLGASMPGSFGM